MDPFALLDRLDDGREDAVLSPYGVRRALDVVRRGARGRTREALDAVLGPDEAPEISADGLALAQAAWLAEGYTPGPALDGFTTGPLEVARVNAWANEVTHGMIPAIVESFGPDEKLALTDAIYLDARWRLPFTPAGRQPFEGAGDVAMMTVQGVFEHAEGAIRLPYGDGDLRFVALLGGGWREPDWSRGRGTVVLPAFSAQSSHALGPALSALGLAPAFVGGDDLEDLFHGPGPKALSRILQRARVDVDEQGTRAAAVTVVTARRTSAVLGPPPFHLIFDRPFTWAVEHAPTGTLLFVGRVRHPRERT